MPLALSIYFPFDCRAEARVVRTSGLTRGLLLFPFFCVMKVSLFLIITTYSTSGNLLTPTVVFVTANLLNALLSTMTRRVPFVIMAFSELLVTTGRLQVTMTTILHVICSGLAVACCIFPHISQTLSKLSFSLIPFNP